MNKEPVVKISNHLDYKLDDSLLNLMSGMGTSIDKRMSSQFVDRKISPTELASMYRFDWLSGKVCDIVPEDMSREGRTLKADQDVIDKVIDEEDRINLWHHLVQAHIWSRVQGTGYIILAVNDNKLPSEPLDLENFKAGSLSHITALDDQRITPYVNTMVEDALDPDFGKPSRYLLVGTNTYIHHTRIIRIEAVQLPFEEFRQNNYKSGSVLERLHATLINFGTVVDGVASMVYDTNVDIYKIPGLMNYLDTPEGTKTVQKRIQVANAMKSFNKALVMDKEESHEVATKQFAGLDSLIVEYGQLLSAASDIPATRLLGSSPKGLNATGDSDLNNYYNMIRAKQKHLYGPVLRKLDTIVQANIGMKMENGQPLPYKWNPLKHMSDEELAALENTRSQRDAVYLAAGVVTEVTVAKELLNRGTYSSLTEEDIEELEFVEDEPDEEDDDELLPSAKNPPDMPEVKSAKKEEEETPEDKETK